MGHESYGSISTPYQTIHAMYKYTYMYLGLAVCMYICVHFHSGNWRFPHWKLAIITVHDKLGCRFFHVKFVMWDHFMSTNSTAHKGNSYCTLAISYCTFCVGKYTIILGPEAYLRKYVSMLCKVVQFVVWVGYNLIIIIIVLYDCMTDCLAVGYEHLSGEHYRS